jgi:hypothetical protein
MVGISGPIFISIGDAEKLNLFLEKNPWVDRDNVLVDDYSFDAYKAAGFGRFDDVDKDVAKEATKNMGAPAIGLKGAWDYATSAGKLAPIPKDMKFGEIPEGVLRLGGTFVVNGNDIKYRWSDRLPGDHPDIEQVLKIAKEESTKKGPAFQLPKFFGL